MKGFTLLTAFFLLTGAGVHTSEVYTVTLEQLQQQTIRPNDTLYIVNFWATWCKPCVAEMPFFEAASAKYATQKVKVVFVSLNYPKEKATVEKFLKQKNISTPSYLLDAGNPNIWIDKIEKQWGGSIPFTIIYKNGKKLFHREGEFTQSELDSVIEKLLE